MSDISQLIDQKINQAFFIKTPKSHASYSSVRKTTTKVQPQTRQKNLLTPKLNLKEDRSLLILAAKTRGESPEKFLSEGKSQSEKGQIDPWKAHKRVALLQHPLWTECIKNWWSVMDPHETSSLETGTVGKITMEQYLDLNVRLQKCLNPDFEYEIACASAVEDWEVDADDWSQTVSIGETQHPVSPTSEYAESETRTSLKTFTFDKFSEFLFELGETWCDGSIERILVIVNCAMLHISEGVHLYSSIFKDIKSIQQLPFNAFSRLADLAKSPVAELDFSRWYQRYFLEIINIRKSVRQQLFLIMPHEARINDLWVMEEGYNQTDVLIQCINRLDALLNRIQKGNPVKLPLKEENFKPKIHPNVFITQSSIKKQKHFLPPIKPKETAGSSQNSIFYSRKVKLTLIGQGFPAKKHSNGSLKKDLRSSSPESKNTQLPVADLKSNITQKLETEASAQVTENDLSFENLFQDLSDHRPYSAPLHEAKQINLIKNPSDNSKQEAQKLREEGLDPENTSKLQFSKIDLKWRKKKFCRAELEKQSPEIGEINTKNLVECYEAKKKYAQEMIKNFDLSRNSRKQDAGVKSRTSPIKNVSQKKETASIDETENLPGVKLNSLTPQNTKSDEKIAYSRNLNNAGKYTFEQYSHLIKPRKIQQLVFEDNLEFAHALHQAKYEFNKDNKSDFLLYQNKGNKYMSKRDELGGCISKEEWRKFIERLEEIIRVTKVRRKRRILNTKKKGKKNGLARGRLWKNVFIKPVNQGVINKNCYFKEANKLGAGKNCLSDDLQKIVGGTVKKLISQPLCLNKPKKLRYSPGRYRVLPSN